ncbi:hypothetical protein PENSPDRAFT_741995 [Peniophora sp. CONT]|nr:hypothetical protein PENSPDRAFT_741995 [Peniophora sp. CONT]
MAQPPPPAPAPSSSDTLQTHLYSAFLNHTLPDVDLNVQGRSWHAIYHAHKVVLVQAGFFRELFTGGFAESSHGGGDVDVVLYDTNITRAAFELCLARLYGGGPALYLSPALIPTTAQPLTPSFPYPPPVAFPPTPAGHQLATPRFLMSLLATAAYLALPTLVAQALGMILKTIGPRTAVPYLKFAIGDGIGEGEEGDDDESPAVGLEGVAEMQLESSAASIAESFETLTLSRSQRSEEHGEVIEEEDVRKEDPEQLGHEDSKESEESDGGLYLRYGGLSDKIGQAAACWLARWGPDMLAYELQVAPPLAAPPTPKTPVLSSPISPLRGGRPSTSPSSSGAGSSSSFREKGKMPFVTSVASTLAGVPPPDVPRVWRRGGLGAAWVRALIASDTLCVRGEKERYELAKTIVELRRAEGVDTTEEQEFTRMFAEGIYYANIPVDDLVALSAERSPTTGRSFVPRSLVQAAHWSASLLRHTIVRPSSSSPPQSPAPGGRANTGNSELGVAVSAAEIKAAVEAGEVDAEMAVWPVRTEVTERVGDTSGLEGASLDELFELPSSASGLQSTHLTRPGGSKGPSPTAADFFGLASDRTKAGDVDGTNGRWTSHPPLRFAAEFWDVDALREKQRLHSHTVWYAGSLYNVYVQLVRRPPRGAQLGVYLHRQSSVDPLPGASAPAGLALALPPPSQSWERTDREIRAERERAGVMSTGRARAGSAATSPTVGPGGSGVGLPYSFSMTPRAGTPTPVPGSPGSAPTSSSPLHSSGSSLSASLPATSPPVNPPAPYRDSRAQVAAYFTVACPSATGSALTRFSSGPDVFAVSQSWGWKSSSLRPDEFAGVNGEGVTPSGPECSVRVAVVIGVV